MSDETGAEKTAKSSGTRPIVVTVEDSYLDRIDDIAEHIRDLGVQIDEILKATGLICGSTGGRLTELRKVPGVMSVEDQPTFEIPPPDAPVH